MFIYWIIEFESFIYLSITMNFIVNAFVECLHLDIQMIVLIHHDVIENISEESNPFLKSNILIYNSRKEFPNSGSIFFLFKKFLIQKLSIGNLKEILFPTAWIYHIQIFFIYFKCLKKRNNGKFHYIFSLLDEKSTLYISNILNLMKKMIRCVLKSYYLQIFNITIVYYIYIFFSIKF